MNRPRVAIVGAGMSGLCMARRLLHDGHEDFVIYEKADDVGGTWRDNTYPGLTCDVPSRFYSYSFAPNPDWSSTFAPGPEIQAYFKRIAGEAGLQPRVRFGTEVAAARWDDGRWRIRTREGEEDVADVLVSATGVLHHPRYPAIEGLDDFEGPLFHSARWDHSVPPQGRRIAVIGNGSSGVQIVAGLAGVAGRLLVFQRTPQWILPVRSRRYSRLSRWAFGRYPGLSRLSYRGYQGALELLLGNAAVAPGWQRSLIAAVCRLNLHFGVRDPELRRRLTPDYEPLCKRVVMSAGFYPALQKPGVELVTDRIERVEPRGVRTRDGSLHEADVVVLATGFDSHAYMRPLRLVGQGGVTLEEAWANGPRAYRTVALPGFPNFFMLMGPHSPIGNQSLIAVTEAQVGFVAWWIEQIRAGRVSSASPTAKATDRFNEELRAAMPDTVWVTGCESFYLGQDGVPEVWPWTPARHRELLSEPELAHFDVQSGETLGQAA